jgi:hypothetical protein
MNTNGIRLARLLLSFGSLLLVAPLLAGCTITTAGDDDTSSACRTDDDCKRSETCVNDKCVASNNASDPSTNGDSMTESSGGCSATGTWYAHFQWSGRTPADLTFVVASDRSVEQPSAPGVTPASGTVSVSGQTLTFVLSDGSTWTGSADASCGFIAAGTMKSSTGNPGAFSARKNACDADGAWSVDFQWQGRTPGALTLDVSGTSAAQESGPGVGAASGTISASGTRLTWTLSDGSTWTGSTDSNCQEITNGTMTSSTGNTGAFVAAK